MLLVIAVTPGVIAQAVATEPREQLHFTVTCTATTPERLRPGSILPM